MELYKTVLLVWWSLVCWTRPIEAVQTFVLVNTCGFSIEDGGFVKMIHTAFDNMVIEFKGEMEYVVPPCASWEVLRELLSSGTVDHVVFNGFTLSAQYVPLQAEFPDLKFSCIDYSPGGVENMTNLQALTFQESSGAFAAGALAGLVSQTKIVGGLMGVPFAALKHFRNGYINGVHHTCPECKVITEYVWSFGAPVLGHEIASHIIDTYNADVFFSAAGFTGVGSVNATVEKGKLAIGVDQDQFYTIFGGDENAPGASLLLSSVVKRMDIIVEKIVRDHMTGRFVGGTQVRMDYTNGGLAWLIAMLPAVT